MWVAALAHIRLGAVLRVQVIWMQQPVLRACSLTPLVLALLLLLPSVACLPARIAAVSPPLTCSYDSLSLSSMDSGSGSDGSGSSGRDPTAAVPLAVVDPRAALDAAHKLTKLPGSATACVVQLCPEQKSLIAANLVRKTGWYLLPRASGTGFCLLARAREIGFCAGVQSPGRTDGSGGRGGTACIAGLLFGRQAVQGTPAVQQQRNSRSVRLLRGSG